MTNIIDYFNTEDHWNHNWADTSAAQAIRDGAVDVNMLYKPSTGGFKYIIMPAIVLNMSKTIDALLEHKELNLDGQDTTNGYTPLMYLCMQQSRYPVDRPWSVNHEYWKHMNRFKIDIDGYITKFLKHGANPNIKDDEGKIAWDYAVKENLPTQTIHRLEEYMLKKLGNKDGIYPNGHTPLTCATVSDNVKMIKKLINEGANPNIPNAKGKTVWDYVTEYSFYNSLSLRYIRKCLSKATVEYSLDKDSLLIDAIKSENVEMIKAFRASGVDFNKEIKIPCDICIPGLMSTHCSPEFLAAMLNKSQTLNAMIECNGVDDILEDLLDQGYPFEPETLLIIRQAAYLKHKQPSKLATSKVPMAFTAYKVKMSAQKGRGE